MTLAAAPSSALQDLHVNGTVTALNTNFTSSGSIAFDDGGSISALQGGSANLLASGEITSQSVNPLAPVVSADSVSLTTKSSLLTQSYIGQQVTVGDAGGPQYTQLFPLIVACKNMSIDASKGASPAAVIVVGDSAVTVTRAIAQNLVLASAHNMYVDSIDSQQYAALLSLNNVQINQGGSVMARGDLGLFAAGNVIVGENARAAALNGNVLISAGQNIILSQNSVVLATQIAGQPNAAIGNVIMQAGPSRGSWQSAHSINIPNFVPHGDVRLGVTVDPQTGEVETPISASPPPNLAIGQARAVLLDGMNEIQLLGAASVIAFGRGNDSETSITPHGGLLIPSAVTGPAPLTSTALTPILQQSGFGVIPGFNDTQLDGFVELSPYSPISYVSAARPAVPIRTQNERFSALSDAGARWSQTADGSVIVQSGRLIVCAAQTTKLVAGETSIVLKPHTIVSLEVRGRSVSLWNLCDDKRDSVVVSTEDCKLSVGVGTVFFARPADTAQLSIGLRMPHSVSESAMTAEFSIVSYLSKHRDICAFFNCNENKRILKTAGALLVCTAGHGKYGALHGQENYNLLGAMAELFGISCAFGRLV